MQEALAYFDTSVLLTRYVRERGTPHARTLHRRYRFLSSALSPVEAISALSRRRDAGELAQRDFLAILSALEKDRTHWELIEVSPLVLSRAEELVQGMGLRTLDAIHIASANVFEAASGIRIRFITADLRQRAAAAQSGLEIVWVA